VCDVGGDTGAFEDDDYAEVGNVAACTMLHKFSDVASDGGEDDRRISGRGMWVLFLTMDITGDEDRYRGDICRSVQFISITVYSRPDAVHIDMHI
jgi:hypothetical protein